MKEKKNKIPEDNLKKNGWGTILSRPQTDGEWK